MSIINDIELNQYRDLIKPATTFEEGFDWKTILGAVFVGVVMLPASMYMGLMLGGSDIGPAAQWVTVILFMEMAKRARTVLKPAEVFILLSMAGSLVGGPLSDFFWRQFFVQSDGARMFGLSDQFPTWYAPSDPVILDQRSFLMSAWFVPLVLTFTQLVISRADSLILGYGLFRVTSDVEKLPFPMAPLGASGITALSENQSGQESWRWRCFCIGTAFGLAFGFLYAAVPTLSGTFLHKPFELLPIPWLDTTSKTEAWLPATATGISFNAGNFFLGMALPFFGMLGTFIGLVISLIANPLLFHAGMLPSWKPGMSAVDVMYCDNVDFYLSFGIGLGIAVAIIGIWQCVHSLRHPAQGSLDTSTRTSPVKLKKGRGDISNPAVILTYLVSSAFYIVLCGFLLHWDFKGSHLFGILLFFAFVYTPFISYATARLEGLAGQVLDLPYVREAAFIFSGYKGINIWLLPIPMANYGGETVNYRTAELIGCSFRSIWKLAAFSLPLVFILSLVYAQFIWSLGPIPSANYPFAQQMWELQAKNTCLVWSSTVAGFSPFKASIKFPLIAVGGGIGLVSYGLLAAFNLPILLIYGVVKGLGQSIPMYIIPQFIGAVFGRYVMAKRFGADHWRQFAPVLFAGYSCGAGLIVMFAVGIKFLSAAIFQLPY